MNNGFNDFNNGSNSDNTRDLNKIIADVMGTSDSSNPTSSSDSGFGSGFGMQYQGPKVENVASEEPVNNFVEPQITKPVVETPQNNQRVVNPFLSKVEGAPVEQNTQMDQIVQPQEPIYNSSTGFPQTSGNTFTSNNLGSGANPYNGPINPTMNDNTTNSSVNSQPNQYTTLDNQQPNNLGSNMPNPNASLFGTQTSPGSYNSVGIQNPQPNMYNNNYNMNQTANSYYPDNNYQTNAFQNQNMNNFDGYNQSQNMNNFNNYNQNMNNNYGDFSTNSVISNSDNYIQEPNSFDNSIGQTDIKSENGSAVLKKFPLSLREMILIAVAIAGVITVIIMYS